MLRKLKSTKLWITVWCMALITYIVATKQSDFVSIATILSAAPMVYCGVNVVQKKICNEKDE